MSNVGELVRRADRLRDHVEWLRREIEDLRQELLRETDGGNGIQDQPSGPSDDCLAVAVALAQNLGTEFSSEEPRELSRRGDDWFAEP